MKLGDKVVVIGTNPIAKLFDGHVGTIVGEKMPSGQFAMITGLAETRWIIKFDNPVTIQNNRIDGSVFAESALALSKTHV